LVVGKGEVDGSCGQLRSYVVKRPVGAQVRLHEEHVEGDSDTGRMAGTTGTGTEVDTMNRIPGTNVSGTSPTRK